MKFVIYTLGTFGDIYPFIAIANMLKQRNHDVLFITNDKFKSCLDDLKIDFYSVSDEHSYNNIYSNPLTWSPAGVDDHYIKFHFPATEKTFLKIKSMVDEGIRPFVIFQSDLSGAKMACAEYGLDHCHIVLAPSSIYSIEDPSFPLCVNVAEKWRSEVIPKLQIKNRQQIFSRIIVPFINPMRKRIGLKIWSMSDIPKHEDAPCLIGLFPDWLRNVPGDWPVNLFLAGFIINHVSGSDCQQALYDFLRDNHQPLVFTFGTALKVDSMLINKIGAVCKKLNLPGVFVSSYFESASIMENNILLIKEANFNWLFPKSRLVCHHGGIGTCSQVIAAGVPQLIAPHAFDQPDNAYNLWKLGISNALDLNAVSVDEIVDSIKELILSDVVQEKLIRYKKLIDDSDSAKVAVDYILRHIDNSINKRNSFNGCVTT